MQSQIQTQNRESGFTLIELSIVLVIIGLIVAGVLVGQDLIKAAEIRAEVSELQNLDAAANTFHNKYGSIPGDIVNGVNFFAAADVAAGATCALTVPGNGSLEDCAGTTATLDGEPAAFWKQLADAALIPNQITDTNLIGGAAAPAAPTVIANAIPAAKIGKGNFVLVYTGGPGIVGGLAGQNVYRITGIKSFAVGAVTQANSLSPLDSLQIDTKKDDGLPGTGTVVASDNIAAFNVAADTYATGAGLCVIAAAGNIPDSYNTLTTNKQENAPLCQLIIRSSF